MQTTFSIITLLLTTAISSTPLKPRNASPIDQGTISLIEQLEGFEPNFYDDANGQKTIGKSSSSSPPFPFYFSTPSPSNNPPPPTGYGHDCAELNDCSTINPPLTQDQATTLLMSDLTSYETCVCAMPNAGALNANQYGALVSFTYNSGCGALSQYFTQQMTSSDFAGICSALPSTNTKGGEVTTRRQQESTLCGTPTGEMSGCTA